jgi:hypothetical protein
MYAMRSSALLVAIAALLSPGCARLAGGDSPYLVLTTPNSASGFAITERLTRFDPDAAPAITVPPSSTGGVTLLGADRTVWRVVTRPGRRPPEFSTDQSGRYQIEVSVVSCNSDAQCRPPRDPAHNADAWCWQTFVWDAHAPAKITIQVQPDGRCDLIASGQLKPG